MPYGLRCWDSNGNLILDSSDSISKVLGTMDIKFSIPAGQGSAPTTTITVQIPAGFDNRFWWGSIGVTKEGNQYAMSDGYLRCVISGTQATFYLSDSPYLYIAPGSSITHRVIYGIY